jgi:hypothetical protein
MNKNPPERAPIRYGRACPTLKYRRAYYASRGQEGSDTERFREVHEFLTLK